MSSRARRHFRHDGCALKKGIVKAFGGLLRNSTFAAVFTRLPRGFGRCAFRCRSNESTPTNLGAFNLVLGFLSGFGLSRCAAREGVGNLGHRRRVLRLFFRGLGSSRDRCGVCGVGCFLRFFGLRFFGGCILGLCVVLSSFLSLFQDRLSIDVVVGIDVIVGGVLRLSHGVLSVLGVLAIVVRSFFARNFV